MVTMFQESLVSSASIFPTGFLVSTAVEYVKYWSRDYIDKLMHFPLRKNYFNQPKQDIFNPG